MKEHRKKVAKKIQSISIATGDKTIGRESPGRPPIEDLKENEGLLGFYKTLTSRFIDGSAHGRRRNNLITSTQTLDQLQEQCALAGYVIKRSTLYTRIYPFRPGAGDSKRHYPLLPMKLRRPTNDARVRHPATGFYFCIKNFALEIAASIGSAAVIFGGFDDKARIPMGIPAASKQGKILVHMEYRIKLPDHDYVKAQKHKLIPSVTCYRAIKDTDQRFFGDSKDAVKYHGPVYVANRSGKHAGTDPFTHGIDIRTHGIDELPIIQDSHLDKWITCGWVEEDQSENLS